MAHEIVMPQLSLSMDSGQIVNWLKQTGDSIRTGDILLEVESDKATVEVETVESGILQIVMGPADGDVPVGAVIAYVLDAGESPVISPSAADASAQAIPASLKAAPDRQAVSAIQPTDDNTRQFRRPPSSPAARRKAVELRVDWQQATGTGRGGRIKERDVVRLSEDRSQSATLPSMPAAALQLTPLARRIADDFGLDDASLAMLIPGRSKLERGDVEEALRAIVRERKTGRSAIGSPVRPDTTKASAPRREPVGVVRKRIAERMSQSVRTYAPVTLTTEIDASALVQVREELKNDRHVKATPSYNVLISKVVAKALCEHPDLNASFDGDEISYWPTINIGLAVDTQRGLMVPVVRDVVSKSISALTNEMAELIDRAVNGVLTSDELNGGTFTITNLGVQDIDGFTPIINPPQCAVLGVGRLRKRMEIVNGEPAIRTMMVLSLTFDHRLIDGAPAARFLQRVKLLLERPYLWAV